MGQKHFPHKSYYLCTVFLSSGMTICSHMKCPFCSAKTKIYNSRSSTTKHETWRRHRCIHCDRSFTSRENIDWNGAIRIKSSTSTSDYAHGTLLGSIISATIAASILPDIAVALADTVEQALVQRAFFTESVQSSQIIKDVCISVLSRYDKHLAIHYSNVVYDAKPPQSVLKSILDL